MKRTFLSVLIFVVVGSAASAQLFMSLAGGVSLITDSRQAVNPLTVTSGSGSVVSFAGDRLGFYAMTSFGLAVQAAAMGTPINLAGYPFRMNVEATLGLGFLLPIGPSFSLLAGIGPTLGLVALIPLSTTSPTYGGGLELGIGGGLTARLQLGARLYLTASGAAAYHFYELVPIGADPLRSAIVFTPSIGVGFRVF
jgi:hypothetical protein